VVQIIAINGNKKGDHGAVVKAAGSRQVNNNPLKDGLLRIWQFTVVVFMWAMVVEVVTVVGLGHRLSEGVFDPEIRGKSLRLVNCLS
jgi:hypothetical protein